jgi:hypothetical protein
MRLVFCRSWGDGFITDKALLAKHNLSDPSPFLATVAKVRASPRPLPQVSYSESHDATDHW